MTQVSSSLTLVLKIAYPIIWGIFLGCFTLVFLLKNDIYFGPLPLPIFRILIVAFFISSMSMIYWVYGRLKRAEMDEEYLYVSNYWKTARYPWHNVDRIEKDRFLFFKIIRVYFKTAGVFGKAIYYMPSKRHQLFLEANPQLNPIFGLEEAAIPKSIVEEN